MQTYLLTMSSFQELTAWLAFCLCVLATAGCGTIREKRATEQLLLSDAVDRSVANIDFSPLAYQKVFLDTRFLQFKNDSALSTNYVVSALRQQMVVAGCLLQDAAGDADYIVEARIGTLGSDGHDMNYGVPASNNLNLAASVVSGVPPLPTLPEISLARRTEDMAAAKIAVFAYHRDTKRPVWQSGTSLARSEATGTWFLGAGPIQRGSIYKGTEMPGIPLAGGKSPSSDLNERQQVFRGTTIWDEELREKVASGEHLVPPEPQPPQAPPRESPEGTEQMSRTDDGEEQR